MVSFPRYEKYKDSGIKSLGKIPQDWEVQSIRNVTNFKSKRNRPDLPILSVYREYGVILKDSRDDNHNATSLDISNYKVVNIGDLVINKMKAWQGSMGISQYDGIISPAYIICTVNQDQVKPKFLHYLLRSKPYIGVYNALSYGVRVGQWDMHYEDFKKICIPIPTFDEQKRIIGFLDRKTEEIDRAIAHKKRLIELLEEQKSIFINQAVTKGLNPNAPMKDSGIEWIGKIPKHWKIVKLKHLSNKITDGEHISPNIQKTGIPLLSAKDVRERFINFDNCAFINQKDAEKFWKRCKPEIGDLLIISRGATVGRIGLVETNQFFCLMGSVILIKPKNIVDSNFLYFSLNQQDVKNNITQISDASAQQAVYLIDVKETRISLPPLVEQIKISKSLNEKTKRYEELIKKEELAIEKLKEFKQILIAEAVTGKIKI